MNKYLGNYLGIVIQNNDPEKKGRVKIFVPHVSVTIYEGWNDGETDKYFSFPIENKDDETTLTQYNIDVLKNILPWAEPALPLFAGNASKRFNAFSKTATSSDANTWEGDEIPYLPRPTQNYQKNNDSISDEFKEQIGNVPPNPYSYDYNPPDYSNAARGVFTIPNVGAHLWVFFIDGDPMHPVYFASSAGGNDFNGIYEYKIKDKKITVDYPALYENEFDTNEENLFDAKTFRSKHVINSNKHTIEMIDTDLREILRLTHYSGSFKEFNNLTTIELATKNDQLLVLGNQYNTVNGYRARHVGRDEDIIIVGDQFIRIGNYNDEIYNILDNIYDYNNKIYQVNRLFNVKRAKTGVAPNEVSIYQTQVPGIAVGSNPPGYAICPVCQGERIDVPTLIEGWYFYSWVPEDYRGVMGMEYSLATMNLNTLKQNMINYMMPLQGVIGKFGEKCATCATLENGFQPTGLSPSTEYGLWMPEEKKEMGDLFKTLQTDLLNLEAKVGNGNQIINIQLNKVETIGSKMNDFKPFRVDPVGKLRVKGNYVAPGGIYVTFKPTPLIEPVDVPDMPGGDYNLTVCNKYKLLVGAKGVDIKTFGPLNMAASIVNFSAEQLNFTSSNEVNIDGGERLNFRSKNIIISSYEHDPFVVDAPLHVSRNTIINGGMYVEGEVGIQHITTLAEKQETLWMGGAGTNSVEISGEETSSTSVMSVEKTLHKTLPPASDVILSEGVITPIPPTDEVPNHIHPIPPHTHIFFNVPIRFTTSKEELRALMLQLGINQQASIVAAMPISQIEYSPDDPIFNKIKNSLLNSTNGYVIQSSIGPTLEKNFPSNYGLSFNSEMSNSKTSSQKQTFNTGTEAEYSRYGPISFCYDYWIDHTTFDDNGNRRTSLLTIEYYVRSSSAGENIDNVNVDDSYNDHGKKLTDTTETGISVNQIISDCKKFEIK